MKSPDEMVAERIIERLRSNGFLSETSLKKLQSKLVAATVSAQDWLLVVDIDQSRAAEANKK